MRKYNIFIFYNDHSISERIAMITQKQLKDCENIKVSIINLKSEFIISELELLSEEERPDIVYIWNNSYNPDLSLNKWDVIDIDPDIYCFTYSEEDRIEKTENFEDGLAYNYILSEKIKEVINILNNPQKVIYIDKESLRVFSRDFETKYDTEILLHYHEYYEVVDSIEKGKEILNIIADERIRMYEKEIEYLESRHINAINSIKDELNKIKIRKERI